MRRVEGLFSHVINPSHGCWGVQPVGGPDPENYHPVLNWRGCRGTVSDLQVSIWGKREQDGFAKVAYDNVGVQYGLKALENGDISAEQFVDLNETIGASISTATSFLVETSPTRYPADRASDRSGERRCRARRGGHHSSSSDDEHRDPHPVPRVR